MRRWVIAVAPLVLALAPIPSPAAGRPPSAHAAAVRLPLAFEPNRGQAASSASYVSHAGFGTASFERTGLALALPLHRRTATHERGAIGPPPRVADVRIAFLGASPGTGLVAERPLPGRVNYLLGADPSGWRRDIPTFGRLRYTALHPGIDLVYEGRDGLLKGTYGIDPGADPRDIRWWYAGAGRPRLDPGGNLLVPVPGLPGSTLTERAPVAWQDTPDGRRAVAVRFDLAPDGTVGFDLGRYDRGRKLTIDPELTYSTYLGGSGADWGQGIAVDGAGNAYLTGQTLSTNFPTQNALQSARAGNYDAYVAKLNPSGSALVYSTYLGGIDYEYAIGLAIDPAGSAYITGVTRSVDYPVTLGSVQPVNRGGYDAFVTKLTPSGSAVGYSTFLGGINLDYGYGIAVDATGNAYLAGQTASPDFPTASPVQPGIAGLADAYVAKLDASGSSLVYSTFLGGRSPDKGESIAVDAGGSAVVTGNTESDNFRTAEPIQSQSGGGAYEAFVARFEPSGRSLVYSTYLGGDGNDQGHGIALDPAGVAWVTGHSSSTDFPSVDPLQPDKRGLYDAFVAAIDPSGSALVRSTYLGGTRDDWGWAVAVDSKGEPHLTGYTNSSDFPLAEPVQPSKAGMPTSYDGFVTRLGEGASTLELSTFLGGDQHEQAGGIGVDAAGNDFVSGTTLSSNFPTAKAFRGTPGGDFDAYVARIGDAPPPPAPPAPLIDAIAGTGSPGFGGDGGDATLALLNAPAGVAMDGAGYLYIADSANHRVRMVSPPDPEGVRSATTIAGTGSAGFGGDGGDATLAVLNAPTGMAMDRAGHLYIADTANHRVRMVWPPDPFGVRLITTIAGSGSRGFDGDGGDAVEAMFDTPTGVAVDPAGNVYVADSANRRVRMVAAPAPDGTRTITTLAGSGLPPGLPTGAGDGLPAALAALKEPYAVAVDPAGNVYVADRSDHRVRVVDGHLSADGTRHIHTLAGTGTAGYGGDGGPAASAPLHAPAALALDVAGSLYVAESGGHRVRVVGGAAPPDGTRHIRTVAGTGVPGTGGDGGPASAAQLASPVGLAFGGGVLVVADSGNHRIRTVR